MSNDDTTAEEKSNQPTVYVVTCGENRRGGRVIGVYDSREVAEDRATGESEKDDITSADWVSVDDHDAVQSRPE